MSKNDLIREAMVELQNCPAGDVGIDGPTIEELDRVVDETGHCFGDDVGYHVDQMAWRLLEKALEAK
jgi:hypothetical protein